MDLSSSEAEAVKIQDVRGPGKASDYLSAEDIRSLHTLSPARVARDGVGVWALILGMMALFAAFPSALSFALAFVVIASRQLALSHLVHDASHYNFSRSKVANDWISDLFFAAPTLISTDSYRRQHAPHHAYLGDWDRDTDRRAWYSIRGARFITRSLWALLGLEAATTLLVYGRLARRADASGGSRWRRPLLVLLTQALLFAYCFWLGVPLAYLGLWLAPLCTAAMYLLMLRVIAEHQTVDYSSAFPEPFKKSLTAPLIRTVQAGPVGRFMLGSMNFWAHHEHHLLPGVPYTELSRMHRLLKERGYFERYSEALGPGYTRTLLRLIFPAGARATVARATVETR